MPSPVDFNLSLAPLPNNFAGTPQQLATAIVDRLTVTPTAPWSSFQNGGVIPSSDLGPVLYNGTEWRVYDTGLGAYTFATQNGAGLVNNTVTLPKLLGGTAGSILYYNSLGRPAELLASSGTNGQTLQLVAGLPAWTTPAPLVTSNYFEVTLGTNQTLNTDGSDQVVQFNSVRVQSNVVFDVANYRVPVTIGSVWMFYVSLQVEDELTASTGVQLPISIASVNNPGYTISGLFNSPALNSRFGVSTMGVLVVSSNDWVRVTVQPNEATPVAGGLSISANNNTRFGGFRLV